MNTEIIETTNGEIPKLELSSDQRLNAFLVEYNQLLEKYRIQLIPYTIRFNNGNQLADAKFAPIE